MAMECSSLGVVEDGLVGDMNVEDDSQDVGSLAGADGKGDEEREDQPEDVGRIVDFADVDGWFERGGDCEIFSLEQVFAVNVTEFEL